MQSKFNFLSSSNNLYSRLAKWPQSCYEKDRRRSAWCALGNQKVWRRSAACSGRRWNVRRPIRQGQLCGTWFAGRHSCTYIFINSCNNFKCISCPHRDCSSRMPSLNLGRWTRKTSKACRMSTKWSKLLLTLLWGWRCWGQLGSSLCISHQKLGVDEDFSGATLCPSRVSSVNSFLTFCKSLLRKT